MELNGTTIAVIAVVVSVLFLLLTRKGEDAKPKAETKKSKPSLVERNMKGKTEKRNYTAEEVSKHNTRDDCWIIVDKKVYDVTEYIDEHPGGDSIMTNAGADSSKGVHGPQHPASMWEVLALYYIGDLQE